MYNFLKYIILNFYPFIFVIGCYMIILGIYDYINYKDTKKMYNYNSNVLLKKKRGRPRKNKI